MLFQWGLVLVLFFASFWVFWRLAGKRLWDYATFDKAEELQEKLETAEDLMSELRAAALAVDGKVVSSSTAALIESLEMDKRRFSKQLQRLKAK
jgi:hypothetical protein